MPPAEINRKRDAEREWVEEKERTRARHADELNRGATAETVAEFRASRFITLAKSEDNLRPAKSRSALSFFLVRSYPSRYSGAVLSLIPPSPPSPLHYHLSVHLPVFRILILGDRAFFTSRYASDLYHLCFVMFFFKPFSYI